MMIRKFELQRMIVIIMIQDNCKADNEERDADASDYDEYGILGLRVVVNLFFARSRVEIRYLTIFCIK